jgi:hypothetical protein
MEWGTVLQNPRGYLTIYMPEHPEAHAFTGVPGVSRGFCFVHRYAMECVLGRLLVPGEIVHHKDGNKCNNDPDNLQLFKDFREHTKCHY